MECGGPVCRVALIQMGLASTYVLHPSKHGPGFQTELVLWNYRGEGLYPDQSCQPADKQVNERRVRVKTGD